jgi:hypothetical protein
MTASELKDKIKVLAKQVYADKQRSEVAAVEYDELTKFPELKGVIVDLLGPQFDLFLASIDWVAPKPTTFRINLKNGENFYLVYNQRSWVAEVEGKKYYLLNLNEEENATKAIARILRYGAPDIGESQDEASFSTTSGGDFDTGGDTGGEDVSVDVTTDTETEEI